MMTDPKSNMLDDLFAEARELAPKPSAALVARVLADAESPRTATPIRKRGLMERMFDMIGGWPAAGGLLAATIAGLWIGVAPPASVEDFSASLMGDPVSVGLFVDELAFEMGSIVDG